MTVVDLLPAEAHILETPKLYIKLQTGGSGVTGHLRPLRVPKIKKPC